MSYYGLYVSCFEGLEFLIIYSTFKFLGSNSPKLVISKEPKCAVSKSIIQIGKFRCLSSAVCNLARTFSLGEN